MGEDSSMLSNPEEYEEAWEFFYDLFKDHAHPSVFPHHRQSDLEIKKTLNNETSNSTSN